MAWMRASGLGLMVTLLAACTHLKGVILEERTNQPLRTAKFSVGRPDGLGSFQTYDVNKKGEFDFYLSPIDGGALYVYDGAAKPDYTMRRLDRSEMSDNMQLRMRAAPANAGRDDLIVPPM